MLEILEDTIIDSVKLIPFLFLTYLLMEYIEHKTKEKTKETIKKSGKFRTIYWSITWNYSTMWLFRISNKLICC